MRKQSGKQRPAAEDRLGDRRPRGMEPLERRVLLSAAVAPIGAQFRIDTVDSQHQGLQVVSDADGDVVAVWQDRPSGGQSYRSILGQRLDAAGNKQGGGPFVVNTYLGGDEVSPRVAIDESGRFVVAWSSYGQDGDQWGIYAQRYTAVGTPQGVEFRVNAKTAGQQSSPDVAINAAGGFAVAWRDPEGIYAQLYDSTGLEVGGQTLVVTATAPAFATVENPRISMATDGSYVIAWEDHDTRIAYFQRFGADGEKAGPIVPALTGASRDVEIEHYDGGFIIGAGFQARRYDLAGMPVDNPIDLIGIGAGEWDLAASPSGAFVTASVTTGTGIVYRRYDAAGVPIGLDVRANTNVNPALTSPAIALADDGQMVVAWIADGAGSNGVYAQRVGPVANPAGVGDRVWADLNRNGLQDPGEPGVDGIQVAAISSDGAMAANTFTSGGGLYRFDNLRPGETYYVTGTVGTNGRWTPLVNQGADDTADSDIDSFGRTGAFTAGAAGSFDSSVDLGYIPPAAVRGFVWFDTDGDGIQDPDEAGRLGTTVQLRSSTGTLVKQTSTGADGTYTFADVLPDRQYYVKVIMSTVLQRFTLPHQGADGGSDSDVNPSTGESDLFTLAPGQLDDTHDAGIQPLARISGTIYRDANLNRRREILEPPVGGQFVFADLDDDGEFDPGESGSSSLDNGNFSIDTAPGTYVLRVAASAGWNSHTGGGQTVTVGPEKTAANVLLPVWPADFPMALVGPVGGEFRVNEPRADCRRSRRSAPMPRETSSPPG